MYVFCNLLSSVGNVKYLARCDQKRTSERNVSFVVVVVVVVPNLTKL